MPACGQESRVVEVVDGDTLDACVDVGFGIWITDRFRLKGINTPEMGTAYAID